MSTRIVASLDIVLKTAGKIPRTKERSPRTGYLPRKKRKNGEANGSDMEIFL